MNKKTIAITIIIVLSILFYIFSSGEEETSKTEKVLKTSQTQNKKNDLSSIVFEQRKIIIEIENINKKIKHLQEQKLPLRDRQKELQKLAEPHLNKEKISNLKGKIKNIEVYLSKNIKVLKDSEIIEYKAQLQHLEYKIKQLIN